MSFENRLGRSAKVFILFNYFAWNLKKIYTCFTDRLSRGFIFSGGDHLSGFYQGSFNVFLPKKRLIDEQTI